MKKCLLTPGCVRIIDGVQFGGSYRRWYVAYRGHLRRRLYSGYSLILPNGQSNALARSSRTCSPAGMARLARVVVPGVAHLVTQRGNRGWQTFFESADYRLYRRLLWEGCSRCGTRVLAYCLMPNHVHLLLLPQDNDGLRAALAEAHRRYTRHVNEAHGWKGHLWEARFASCPVDVQWVPNAIRYIEDNPVRAALVATPEDWRWSSTRLRSRSAKCALPIAAPEPARSVQRSRRIAASHLEALRRHVRTGRPLGDPAFVAAVETTSGRILRPWARPEPGRFATPPAPI